MPLLTYVGTCVLKTEDTEIIKTVTTYDKIDEYCLGEAIAKAILAFDAANPSTGSTLRDRVIKLLQETNCCRGQHDY